MIQAVVFDMDGTMFNTEDSFIAECMKIQESLGMKPDREMQLMAIGSHSDYIEAMMRERLKGCTSATAKKPGRPLPASTPNMWS